jgi:hypothetical protein
MLKLQIEHVGAVTAEVERIKSVYFTEVKPAVAKVVPHGIGALPANHFIN